MTADSNFEPADPESEETDSAAPEPADTEPTTPESETERSDSATRSQAKGPDEQYCSSCGGVIKKEAEICPECGVRQKQSSNVGGEKSPGVAALLSFIFTGAGQIYNGQVGKGIGLFVLQIINVGLMIVVIGFFTYLATWGYAIYDAYNTAEKINNGEVQV